MRRPDDREERADPPPPRRLRQQAHRQLAQLEGDLDDGVLDGLVEEEFQTFEPLPSKKGRQKRPRPR